MINGYNGVGNLNIINQNVNAENYVSTLSENPIGLNIFLIRNRRTALWLHRLLLDSVEYIFGDRNQHNNAPAQTARRTVAWLE